MNIEVKDRFLQNRLDFGRLPSNKHTHTHTRKTTMHHGLGHRRLLGGLQGILLRKALPLLRAGTDLVTRSHRGGIWRDPLKGSKTVCFTVVSLHAQTSVHKQISQRGREAHPKSGGPTYDMTG